MSDIYTYLVIEPLKDEPLYLQLVNGFERFCSANEPGAPVPPEREMSEKLGVSRTALRHALAECVERGLLVKRWAKGIFVADRDAPKRILVIAPGRCDLSSPVNYIMPGIDERANELAIRVDKLSDEAIYNRSEEFVSGIFRREKFAGVLDLDYICGLEPPAISALRRLDIPVYFPHTLKTWAEKSGFIASCIDEKAAFAEALGMLVARGHRRIATVSHQVSHTAEPAPFRGYSRKDYLRLLKDSGAEASPELLFNVRYSESEIAQALDSMLKRGIRFTAVLCISDFYAIHVMKILADRKIRVPEDVSVMGYCGYPDGRFLSPPLTTIDFNYHAIGRNAVDRLLLLARGNSAAERLSITPHQAVIRESVRECPPDSPAARNSMAGVSAI